MTLFLVVYEPRSDERDLASVDACISSLGNTTRVLSNAWVFEPEKMTLDEFVAHLVNDDKKRADGLFVTALSDQSRWARIQNEKEIKSKFSM